MAMHIGAVALGLSFACVGGLVGGLPADAAQSTGSMGVSAVVSNSCEVAVQGNAARVLCTRPNEVTLTVTGSGAVRVPLRGASPTLIPLPQAGPGGAPVLVIAY